MDIEEIIEKIKRQITIGECEKNIGIPVYISDLKTVLAELENKQDDINILQAQRDSMEYQFNQVKAELKKKENMYIKEYNEHMEKKRQNGVLINNEQILKRELEKKDKRISDLEFTLMDMVLQFADESKDKIGTMGLSALEIAFGELDFDNPMPIKEVHKRYKKLAQEYYKVEREGK